MKNLILILCVLLIGCSKKGNNNGNNNGVGNHNAMIFDASGNAYDTVDICGTVWLTSNLKTTKYNNGDAITNITDKNTWLNYGLGAYCSYNNSGAYSDIYGYLYNGFAVSDLRGIAPSGFHIATQADWQNLVNCLGGYLGSDDSVAGGAMKQTGYSHWILPNTGATNSSGFTSLPAGMLDVNGFDLIGEAALYWSSTYYQNINQYFIYTNGTGHSGARPGYAPPNIGLSVRCVKD